MLAEAGWDVERDGLMGAPRVRVVAGAERHATIDRSLRLLGFGTAIVEPVAADANGAIDIADLARVLAAGPAGPTLVCLQAGNVNTGACDNLRAGHRVSSASTAAGCTWTARSGCGRRPTRPPVALVDGHRTRRLLGAPTGTSG